MSKGIMIISSGRGRCRITKKWSGPSSQQTSNNEWGLWKIIGASAERMDA